MTRTTEKTNDPIKTRTSIRDFFGPAPGALKNHLNSVELSRITITALTAGGGIMALLQAILLNIGTIFPAPTDAALATVFLTLILEALRRLDHGQENVPVTALPFHPPGGNGDTSPRHRTR